MKGLLMDAQTLFNLAIGAAGALGMWVLNGIKESMQALHRSDLELSAKVQNIELLVAGAYVKKEELDRMTNALFVKLDKIDSKLDNKADKSTCDQVIFRKHAINDITASK